MPRIRCDIFASDATHVQAYRSRDPNNPNRHTDTKHPDSLTGTPSAPNNQVTRIFVPDGAGQAQTVAYSHPMQLAAEGTSERPVTLGGRVDLPYRDWPFRSASSAARTIGCPYDRLETSAGRSLAWGLPCLTLWASGQLMVMLPVLVA